MIACTWKAYNQQGHHHDADAPITEGESANGCMCLQLTRVHLIDSFSLS